MPEVRVNARRKLLVAASAVLLTTPLASLGQQQSKVARIDYLAASSIANNARYAQAFREALHELGYVEGKNLVIEYRWAEGNFERLPDLAAELVRLRVDVILAVGDPVHQRPDGRAGGARCGRNAASHRARTRRFSTA